MGRSMVAVWSEALTVHVYVAEGVSPATVIGELVPVAMPGVPPFAEAHDAAYVSAGGVDARLCTPARPGSVAVKAMVSEPTPGVTEVMVTETQPKQWS